MAKGKVLSIHTCGQASDPMSTHGEVQAIRRQGLRGDRYLSRTGTYSKHHAPDRELTLIESEALEALRREHGITLEPEETRRNLVTEGISLQELIGKQFRVGEEVVLEGIRPCEPCGYLEEITGKKVFEPLKERGGLRTSIVQGGTIRVGDAIAELAEAEAVAAVPTPGGG